MFADFLVPIPSLKGKVFKKNIRNTDYIYYEYEDKYSPDHKYSLPKRTSIGKVCIDDSSMMYPNSNYYRFFPAENIDNQTSSNNRCSLLNVGTYFIIDKILEELNLKSIIESIIGDKYGLFLDFLAYGIVCENNAAQYYPYYAKRHPLFTDNMRIYSDSTISDFLKTITEDDSIEFLNQWNKDVDINDKIYISYDSTNKPSQEGEVNIVEPGHSKNDKTENIFNYSIALDVTNRKMMFYEKYSGSIVDVSQLEQMINKALSFGYKNIGLILDRGYFSIHNIYYMDERNIDFIIMVKGMKKLVREVILNNKGTFEKCCDNYILEYGLSGMTIERPIFPKDEGNKYLHLYYNGYTAANKIEEFLQEIDDMEKDIKKNIGKNPIFPNKYYDYFDFFYWHEGKADQTLVSAMRKKDAIDEEISLCGYFSIISSAKMDAKEAISLYKSRDASEKLFRGDKSYLGNAAERVHSNESFNAKIFIEFVALIVRQNIYTSLIDKVKETGKRRNYMTVPAAIAELEGIQIVRFGDNASYHLDHAITKTQAEILDAFNIDVNSLKKKVAKLCSEIDEIDKGKNLPKAK